MEKKIDETIEDICSWINDRLNDSMMVEDAYATANMVTALADLVSTRGLIKCIQDKPDYDTQNKLNVAYGWLEEELRGTRKVTYTTAEVLELVKAFLGEGIQ